MTTSEPLQQVDRTYVWFKGAKLSYFSGCDYFRLASEPRVMDAAKKALEKFGLNVAASRATTGNHLLYEELEAAAATFFHVSHATLVSTGYLASQVVAQALAGEIDHALIDEHAHPCLFDATRFLACPVTSFKHRDPGALSSAASRIRKNKRLLVMTDGMFSRDGSVAPLNEYLRVLPPSARLLVDDSHGAGVLGPTGRGSLEHEHAGRSRIVQTLTLSKAFGAFGGVVLSSGKLRRAMLSRSRCLIGTTPIPLPLAAAGLEALRLLARDQTRLTLLRANQQIVAALLPRLTNNPGPIICLPVLSPAHTRALRGALLTAGIYPPLVRYHSSQPFFRFVLSSEHKRHQLDALITCLRTHAPVATHD